MELNFKSFGQGEPVIILHGLFGMLDNWMTIGKRLSEHYAVYLVDLRNHGKSPHTQEHSYALMAGDLVDFFDQQWLHQASVIGHSMGGKVAMQFALDNPGVVNKLVVVDIAPKMYPPHHQDVLDTMLSFDPSAADNRRDMLLHLQSHLRDARTVHFLMKNLSRSKEGGFRWKMNLDSLVANYRELNETVTYDDPFEGDALFIRGAESAYIADEDMLEILEIFPRAKLSTIEGAGHWVHADKPDALLESITAFLG